MKSHPFAVGLLLLLGQLGMSGEIVAAQPPALHVGAAAVDITPPVGYRRSGGYGELISTGVNDPLFAKALVLRDAALLGRPAVQAMMAAIFLAALSGPSSIDLRDFAGLV